MRIYFGILSVISMFALVQTVAADEGHREHGNRVESRHQGVRGVWYGDIRRFHEHDLNIWRGGHWHQGWHSGHYAWWWVSGGIWYAYQNPVYPYPDPYQPPVAVLSEPPVSVAPLNPPQPTQYWYYCTKPAGYYPYIPQCQSEWQKVPATSPPDVP